ncbi:MAG: DUF5063 domain-containing protein [Actinomycetota bacterium]
MEDFAQEIADQVGGFLLAVSEISRAGRGEEASHAVALLLLQVSQLLLAGGRLGAIADVLPDERFEPDPGYDPDVDGLRERLGVLLAPIDEYAEVFDPYGDAVPETYRLSDDLAAVALDLAHGLKHFRAGRVSEALWWWQFSYLSSWGGSASAALRALQSVVAHDRLDETHRAHDRQTQLEDRLLAESADPAVSPAAESAPPAE